MADKNGKIIIGNDKDTITGGDVSGFDFWGKTSDDGQTSYIENISGHKWYISVLSDEITGWTLLGVVSEDENNASIKAITSVVSGAGLLGSIIGILIALFVAINMAREVKKVQSALKNVADGDLTHRITTKRRDEFGQLESSFNEMTSHISELISDVEISPRILLMLPAIYRQSPMRQRTIPIWLWKPYIILHLVQPIRREARSRRWMRLRSLQEALMTPSSMWTA